MLTSSGQQGGSRSGKGSGIRIISQLSYHSHAQGTQEDGPHWFSWVWCCVSPQPCPSTALSVCPRTNLSLCRALFPTPTQLPDKTSRRKCRVNVVMRRVSAGRPLPRVSAVSDSSQKQPTHNVRHGKAYRTTGNKGFTFAHFRSSVSRFFTLALFSVFFFLCRHWTLRTLNLYFYVYSTFLQIISAILRMLGFL